MKVGISIVRDREITENMVSISSLPARNVLMKLGLQVFDSVAWRYGCLGPAITNIVISAMGIILACAFGSGISGFSRT